MKLIPFALTFAMGILIAGLFGAIFASPSVEVIKSAGIGSGHSVEVYSDKDRKRCRKRKKRKRVIIKDDANREEVVVIERIETESPPPPSDK